MIRVDTWADDRDLRKKARLLSTFEQQDFGVSSQHLLLDYSSQVAQVREALRSDKLAPIAKLVALAEIMSQVR